MEMNFILTGNLSITGAVDEFGPVEIELIFFIIFMIAGIFGVSGVEKPVVNSFEFLNGIVPKFVLWQHLLSSFFIFLLIFFTLENLVKCFIIDKWVSFKLIMPSVINISIAILSAYFDIYGYQNQFVLYHFLFQMCNNIVLYRLMLVNMTKSSI